MKINECKYLLLRKRDITVVKFSRIVGITYVFNHRKYTSDSYFNIAEDSITTVEWTDTEI